MSNNEHSLINHLRELKSSDFVMVNGEPDIRNWKVVGVNNQEVGKIKDLLFDEVSHRVRYVIVDVNGKSLNLLSREILVPVGLVELLGDEKAAVISQLTVGNLAALPTYEAGKVTAATENAVRSVLAPNAPMYEGEEGTSFYNHEHFRDDKFYQTRPQMKDKEVMENAILRKEIKEHLEGIKKSVEKMEVNFEKLEKSSL